MMKRIASLAIVPFAALAACGQEDEAANQAIAPANIQALPEESMINDAAEAGQPDIAEPVQRPPDAELSIPPVKPKAPVAAPKPPPPPPPPPPAKSDPHAGHDMANMANAQ
jgi:hypothetical protein